MSKKSSIEKNNNRRRLVKKFAGKRERLLAVANDESKSMEERFEARLKLAELPRNANPTRLRNRCEVTGRPRGYYRKLGMSRIGSREVQLVRESWQ
jgi:small subunit ribosomal protein S14